MRLIRRIDQIFERVNILQGGLGDDLDVDDVNRDQVIAGIAVEFEHIHHDDMKKYTTQEIADFLDGIHDNFTAEEIKNFQISQDIVMDHLAEIPTYYDYLEDMEDESKIEGDFEGEDEDSNELEEDEDTCPECGNDWYDCSCPTDKRLSDRVKNKLFKSNDESVNEGIQRFLPRQKKLTCPTCRETLVTKDRKCPECGDAMIPDKIWRQFDDPRVYDKESIDEDDEPMSCKYCGRDMEDVGMPGGSTGTRLFGCPSCDSDLFPDSRYPENDDDYLEEAEEEPKEDYSYMNRDYWKAVARLMQGDLVSVENFETQRIIEIQLKNSGLLSIYQDWTAKDVKPNKPVTSIEAHDINLSKKLGKVEISISPSEYGEYFVDRLIEFDDSKKKSDEPDAQIKNVVAVTPGWKAKKTKVGVWGIKKLENNKLSLMYVPAENSEDGKPGYHIYDTDTTVELEKGEEGEVPAPVLVSQGRTAIEAMRRLKQVKRK